MAQRGTMPIPSFMDLSWKLQVEETPKGPDVSLLIVVAISNLILDICASCCFLLILFLIHIIVVLVVV